MSGISTSFRPAYGKNLIPVGITVKVGGEMPKVMHFSLGRGREKTFGRDPEVQPGSAQLAMMIDIDRLDRLFSHRELAQVQRFRSMTHGNFHETLLAFLLDW